MKYDPTQCFPTFLLTKQRLLVTPRHQLHMHVYQLYTLNQRQIFLVLESKISTIIIVIFKGKIIGKSKKEAKQHCRMRLLCSSVNHLNTSQIYLVITCGGPDPELGTTAAELKYKTFLTCKAQPSAYCLVIMSYTMS